MNDKLQNYLTSIIEIGDAKTPEVTNSFQLECG